MKTNIDLISREMIQERLPYIFPLGTPGRSLCISPMAARVIFTMIYTGAIEGIYIYQSCSC